jgi:hypothetical protein
MGQRAKRVVAITPVYKEPSDMVRELRGKMKWIKSQLAEQSISFEHYFLDDRAQYLPMTARRLIRHPENKGLARTLVEGYGAALNKNPDIIIRIDAQPKKNDPRLILDIVNKMLRHERYRDALILPVLYGTGGKPDMHEVRTKMREFFKGLSPIKEDAVLSIYNEVFPMGYQAYSRALLADILPSLEKGIEIFERTIGLRATWGLDLLAILLAWKQSPATAGYIFGGMVTPWTENITHAKTLDQRRRSQIMIQIARDLGCI